MGLPFELWDRVVGFLDSNPYALLSCCLTCKRFRRHAENRLDSLSRPTIDLGNLSAMNHFVEEIRTIPGRARPVVELTVEDGPPLAFSLVPIRLATQLVNLRTLCLNYIVEAPNVPSSTWILYGRAFPGVAHLQIWNMQFPSFMDFIRFVTSFRAVKRLELSRVSCAHPGVPPSVLWSPRKLNLLERLDLEVMEDDESHFFERFLHWFFSRGGIVQHLAIGQTVLSHPSGFLLLENIHEHLQQLTSDFLFFSPTDEFQKVWQRFIGEYQPSVSLFPLLILS